MRACNSCGNLVDDFEACDFCIEWRLENDKLIKKLEKQLEELVLACRKIMNRYDPDCDCYAWAKKALAGIPLKKLKGE